MDTTDPFFRGLDPRLQMKVMVMPVSRSLVFPDHRQKIFRTLPITGKKYFVLYLSQAIKFSYSTENGGRSQTISDMESDLL